MPSGRSSDGDGHFSAAAFPGSLAVAGLLREIGCEVPTWRRLDAVARPGGESSDAPHATEESPSRPTDEDVPDPAPSGMIDRLVAATRGGAIHASRWPSPTPAMVQSLCGEDHVLGVAIEWTPVSAKADGQTAEPELVWLRKAAGKRTEGIRFAVDGTATIESWSRSQVKTMVRTGDVAVVRDQPLHSHEGEHATPLRRFAELLRLERREIGMTVLFALVAGVLGLATPLAIEALVNVVSWGISFQAVLVLGLMLLVCLGLAGAFRVLQTYVVEMIQRRQFARLVGDLSFRYSRADQTALANVDRSELNHRFFDIMTIQKATTILLLDGVTLVLTTVIGLVLLAFYHPFLLGFDLVLVIVMLAVTRLMGRGGIRTAVTESKQKYKNAVWLRDVLEMPDVFALGGGGTLAVERASKMTVDYLEARQQQFRVVIRQVALAISVQVIASVVLLALGGYLVIDGQLTLGQLVASELVVTTVVGAFSKAGKSLEKFYDLMAGVDKVGHLLDIPMRAATRTRATDGPLEVRWSDLKTFAGCDVAAGELPAGSVHYLPLEGGNESLLDHLSGRFPPPKGHVDVGGYPAVDVASNPDHTAIMRLGPDRDIFTATLAENLRLGRLEIGGTLMRSVLAKVGLGAKLASLPDNLETQIYRGGHPLSAAEGVRLLIARALLLRPGVLLVDQLFDDLTDEDLDFAQQVLAADDRSWTLLIGTANHRVAKRFGSPLFSVEESSRGTR